MKQFVQRSPAWQGKALAAVLVLLGALPASVALQSEAGAEVDDFHTITNNIYKVYKDDVVGEAVEEGALTVAMQESCANNGAVYLMQIQGYTSEVFNMDPNGDGGCQNAADLYVIAFTKAAQANTGFDAAYSLSVQWPSEPSDFIRGYACIKGAWLFWAWWSCSTHITTQDSPYGINQSNEFRVELWNGSVYDGETVIAAGDFNLLPSQLHSYWEQYWNMDDEYRSPRLSTSGAGKIDYIWTDMYSTTSPVRPDGAVHYLGYAEVTNVDSDHHLVHATFVWP